MNTHANRGMTLESIVEYSNNVYETKGLFAGFKVPTPMNQDKKGRAFYQKKSTVDFVGLYKGTPVAFDCKETSVKTNFPFKNIHDHQIEFMEKWVKQGGQAFFLVEFTKQQKHFILTVQQLSKFKADHDRKSVPLSFFEEHCLQVKSKAGIPLHYFEYIEKHVEGAWGSVKRK